MSGHIINDFKDLRSLIGEITKANPAKTTYQQNAEKMGVYKEAEAQPKDDKKDKPDLKKHAGEEDIKKAYMKLGRAAQGSVEHQRKLVQKQLAKMGFKTYSKFGFDNIFKFESNQMIAKWLINEVQLGMNMLQRDFPNVWATKDSKLYRILNTLIIRDGFTTLLKSYKKDKKNFVDDLKGIAKSMARQKRAGFGPKDMQYINKPKKGQSFWSQFDESNLDEGGMKRLFQDLEDGASAQQISKKYGIDMKTAKTFVDNYKKVSQAPRLRAAQNDPLKEANLQEEMIQDFEIRFGNESDWKKADKLVQAYLRIHVPKHAKALLSKDYVHGPDPLMVAFGDTNQKLKPPVNLNKLYNSIRRLSSSRMKYWQAIPKKQEQDALGEETIQEGTWEVPDSKEKMTALNKVMNKKLIIKTFGDEEKAQFSLGKYVGDDGVYDDWASMLKKHESGSAAMDARDAVVKFLKDWGFKVKNYQITHYPVAILEVKEKRGKGNIQRPKRGKLLKLDNTSSRETKLKEEQEHAKQSPFKLKSQQVPRAIAVNTDGFGHRHATVDDIIAACDSFGMILDKELQVEQIQKQLGKEGFISFKQTDLEEVFHARETQRIILTLESTVEKQEPIGYTKEEIIEAYIMGEEIEFLKPDGFKTVGPVLKKSGNTYNVKDKFTGKSYTYKYIGETEVKTFKEVSSINEAKFSKQLIKQAGGIAFDKRYYMGNMSGAVKAIEKLKKGLSDDPKVKDMLRIANEDNLASMDEYIKADGTRRRVHASDQRLKDNNKIKEGDKEEYEKFFDKVLKKFGVKSPAELDDDKKKEFFDYIDKNWKGDHEEVDVHSTYKVDGRRKNFREKMRKLGYIKAAR